MLSLLKKKKKPDAAASEAPQVPAWHPNFRNYQQLPDIKVVRTAFFVNGAAVFVALGLAVAVQAVASLAVLPLALSMPRVAKRVARREVTG